MVNFSGKRTKSQQKRLLNSCISKLILIESNNYHNNTPLSPQDRKTIQKMLSDLSRMESKY